MYSKILDFIDESKVRFNEPMKNHITMKVGGPADVMVLPKTLEDLQNIMKYCKENEIKWYVIGNGSNLLVEDEGIRGIVIKLGNSFSNILVEDDKMTILAGTGMPKLAMVAKKNELTGAEFACGIPGSLGGGVKMNAGAYDGQMSDIVVSAKYIDSEGNIGEFNTPEQLDFGYRKSIFAKNKNLIVVEAVLKLKKGNINEIEEKMKTNSNSRTTKQPLEYPSAGSVFKRPQGYFVGKLVRDAGLAGTMVGGAQVSEKHTGFIINKDNATCKDILDLIELVRQTVNEKFGVLLEREVEILGGSK